MTGLRKLCGFTLLEVMIALLVIVIGAAAVMNTSTESAWKSTQLWQRTVAGWVAQNEIARFRARRAWGNDRNYSGRVKMANADWQWQLHVTDTDDPQLRRLDIEVLDDHDKVQARMTGFMGRL